MKLAPTHLVLLFITPAFAQIGDWGVSFGAITGQSIAYTTEKGAGTNPNTKLLVTDLCRVETDTRVSEGEMYPGSSVEGISVATTDVADPDGTNAGGGTTTFTFVEGIDQNTDIYTDNGDDTATVSFCVLAGIYDDTFLINFAEAKVTYQIDLTTNFAELTGYTITQAAQNTDVDDHNLAFSGTINAFFCNETTQEILTDDGSILHQGETLFICFSIPDGQFEVDNVKSLTVQDSDASPSQLVIDNYAVQTATTPYAVVVCTDGGVSTTNVCVVEVLLKADFYEFGQMDLTGTGTLRVELGDASRRRQRRRGLRGLQDDTEMTVDYFVKKQTFTMDTDNTAEADSTGKGVIAGAIAGGSFAALAGSALAYRHYA